MNKTLTKTFIASLTIALCACGHGGHNHEDHEHMTDMVDSSGNAALLEEVDKLHMEAMDKMDALEKKKADLTKELESAAADKKKTIEDAIAKLDSTHNEMMDWMHHFHPLPDSVDKEKAREYLENEMEKIKKVKDDMMEALEAK